MVMDSVKAEIKDTIVDVMKSFGLELPTEKPTETPVKDSVVTHSSDVDLGEYIFN